MIPLNAFAIVSEFKFEIGSALLGTKQVQNGLNGLQNTVDGINYSLAKMGASFVMGSTGLTSFVGVMGSAINASDKFRHLQLDIANSLSANTEVLQGPVHSWNDQLKVSKRLLEEIGQQALKFSLPADYLAKNFQTVNNMLMGKGLAGDNFGNSIDVSRNLLKSAANLGLDPADVQGQLLRSIEGSASMGDTLFRRLVSETDIVKGLKGNKGAASAMFNVLPATERFKRLNEALGKFASNSHALEARVDSVSGQINILKELLGASSILSIFRPLGDALSKPIVAGLKYVNQTLQSEGRAIVIQLSKVVDQIVAEPQKLVANLLWFRRVLKDFGAVKSALQTTAFAMGIGQLLKFLGVTGMFATRFAGMFFGIMTVLGEFGSRISPVLGPLMKFVGALGGIIVLAMKFPKFAALLSGAIRIILGPIGIMMLAFSLLSRAQTFANMKDFAKLPELTKRFSELVASGSMVFMKLASGFMYIFDGLAQLIAVVFQNAAIWSFLITMFQGVVNVITLIIITIEALGAALGTFLAKLVTEGMSGSFVDLIKETGLAYMEQFVKGFDEAQGKIGKEGGATTTNHVNMKVDMQNNFKEMMEPDRVAFTIKDQLMKAATSRTQGRNGSYNFAPRIAGATQEP
jgi:hypothetical protein